MTGPAEPRESPLGRWWRELITAQAEEDGPLEPAPERRFRVTPQDGRAHRVMYGGRDHVVPAEGAVLPEYLARHFEVYGAEGSLLLDEVLEEAPFTTETRRHGEEWEEQTCPQCGFKSADPAELRAHLMAHVRKGG